MNHFAKNIFLFLCTAITTMPSSIHSMSLQDMPIDIHNKIIGHIAIESKDIPEARATLTNLMHTNRHWKALIPANQDGIVAAFNERKEQVKQDMLHFLSAKLGQTPAEYEEACKSKYIIVHRQWGDSDTAEALDHEDHCNALIADLDVLIKEYIKNGNLSLDCFDEFFKLYTYNADKKITKAFKKFNKGYSSLLPILQNTKLRPTTLLFHYTGILDRYHDDATRERAREMMTMLNDYNLFHTTLSPYDYCFNTHHGKHDKIYKELETFLRSTNCSKKDRAFLEQTIHVDEFLDYKFTKKRACIKGITSSLLTAGGVALAIYLYKIFKPSCTLNTYSSAIKSGLLAGILGATAYRLRYSIVGDMIHFIRYTQARRVYRHK
jgi:hypothetical protein